MIENKLVHIFFNHRKVCRKKINLFQRNGEYEEYATRNRPNHGVVWVHYYFHSGIFHICFTDKNNFKSKYYIVKIQNAESSQCYMHSVWVVDISLKEILRRCVVIFGLPLQLVQRIKLNCVWRAMEKRVLTEGVVYVR